MTKRMKDEARRRSCYRKASEGKGEGQDDVGNRDEELLEQKKANRKMSRVDVER